MISGLRKKTKVVWGGVTSGERERELAKETPCASGTFCIHPSKDPYIDLSPLHPSVFQLSVDPFRDLHRSQQLPNGVNQCSHLPKQGGDHTYSSSL